MLKRFQFFTVLMLSFILIFSLSSGAFAATVGQQLTDPEAGWQRYDDTSSSIKRTGAWLVDTHAGYYGGDARYSTGPDSKVSFDFIGTKLRLIGFSHTSNRVTVVDVFIDGVKVFTINPTGPSVRQSLDFEITSLSNAPHTVEIVPYGSQTSVNYVLDAIDIDADGYLVNTTLSAPLNLSASSGDSKVDLNWATVSNAASYNIKRSTTVGGPYIKIASGVTVATYSDIAVANGKTYYYVVTAVNANGESLPSNEASATPQGPVVQPETGRAILAVTLTTGQEKEYDLSMAEVNSFISWYEGKAAGSGTASYAIDKHDNNKGPFKARKDYVIFDKILTFEVNEYEVTE